MLIDNKEQILEKAHQVKVDVSGEESVAKKLKRSFFIVGGTSAVIILIAICFLVNLSFDVNTFHETSYMTTSYTWNARSSLYQVQTNLLKATSTYDRAKTDEFLDVAQQGSASLAEAIEKLSSTGIATPEQMKQINESLTAMKITRANMVDEANINTEESNAKAVDILMNEYAPPADTLGLTLADIGKEADKKADRLELQAFVKAVLCVIFVVILFIVNILITLRNAKVLIKKINKPLLEIEGAVKELANGNLDVQLNFESKDEFGSLAYNLRATIKELRNYINDITAVLNKISDKDMRSEVTQEYKGSFLPLKNSLNYIIEFLNDMISKIKEAASQVSQGSNQMAEASQSLAIGAGEQSSSVEELLATIVEVAEAVEKNAENAQNVNGLSEESMKEIERGNQYMRELLKAMTQIADQSKEVSNIVKLIDGISSQTNMLSLNASIEAARAGEHGAGFAVVAGEIGKLASESADAARNSTELINKTLDVVEKGLKLTTETSDVFDSIVKSSETTGNLVGDIAGACSQQSTSLAEVLKGVQQIADITESNSAIAEETSASSEELSSEAEMLFQMLSAYKIKG